MNQATPAREGPGNAQGRITVALQALPAPDELERAWKALEARARPSFFLSWHWIGTWLACLPAHSGAWLLRVEREGHVTGLAILVPRTVWRHGFVRSRGLYLHATGDPILDEIHIEHNGFLAERGREREVAQAAIGHLLTAGGEWDELFLDGVRDPEDLERLDLGGARMRSLRRGPSRYVDLDRVRVSGRSYAESLGKSTRYNVRRSQREFEKGGALALTEASTLEEAREFLGRLRELHQRYWKARGLPGSFAHEHFGRFHECLLERAFADGAIQLVRVCAGTAELGYLYNYVHGGRVYSYQSGFAYAGANLHQRPGLVAHVLAIEHNAALGRSAYDLLAGDSDFKRSLANAEEPMAWQVLQRPRFTLRLEDALRRARARFLHTDAGGTSAPAASDAGL